MWLLASVQPCRQHNEELVKMVKSRIGGIDLLVESKPENLQTDLAMMNPGGRVILLGPHEQKVQLYLRPFLAKEVYLSGINLANAKVNDLYEVMRLYYSF